MIDNSGRLNKRRLFVVKPIQPTRFSTQRLTPVKIDKSIIRSITILVTLSKLFKCNNIYLYVCDFLVVRATLDKDRKSIDMSQPIDVVYFL